jgi:hypothetical protein
MGGATSRVVQAVGLDKKPSAQPINMADLSKSVSKASRMDEEQGARMRGARRRGRQLLSDARLNAESGVETLGGGQSLG